MNSIQHHPATLLLEDGTFFSGHSVGKKGTSGGEICFNTGMTGYQETYTDPSYYGQIIVNTNSHIGNYGTNKNESENNQSYIKGVVINQFSSIYSRTKAEESLQNYLEQQEIVGIAGVDTRAIVRHIRNIGSMNAIISSEITTKDQINQLQKKLEEIPQMKGLELSSKACTQSIYTIGNKDALRKIAILDLGCKKSIINQLSSVCFCKVFPAKTSAKDIIAWGTDAYFISNGPGDPSVMDYAISTIKDLIKTNKPVFGICLGHQLIALSNGISTYKMHHGHRGANHPVKNLINGKCEITSQNHGFAINEEDLKASKNLEITHLNLNDGTIEGIKMKEKPVFSVQYHPEASPGPHDSRYLFNQFFNLIEKQ